MAINQIKESSTKAFKYTFEAFGKEDYVLTTRDNWDEVQDNIKETTGCSTAQITSLETVEVSAEQYAEHSFYKLKTKLFTKSKK